MYFQHRKQTGPGTVYADLLGTSHVRASEGFDHKRSQVGIVLVKRLSLVSGMVGSYCVASNCASSLRLHAMLVRYERLISRVLFLSECRVK